MEEVLLEVTEVWNSVSWCYFPRVAWIVSLVCPRSEPIFPGVSGKFMPCCGVTRCDSDQRRGGAHKVVNFQWPGTQAGSQTLLRWSRGDPWHRHFSSLHRYTVSVQLTVFKLRAVCENWKSITWRNNSQNAYLILPQKLLIIRTCSAASKATC